MNHAGQAQPRQIGRSQRRFMTKYCPLEEGMATTSVFLPKKPINSLKRQKDMTMEDELPRLEGVQYAIGEVVVVGQSLVVWFSVTLWIAACQASLAFIIFWSLLKLISIELVLPSNHLILHCPLLFLPSICPSLRVLPYESAFCIRWAKYQGFSISPFNEYSGLISFRINWCDLLAPQGTFKSIPQHHNSKHWFFGVQHSLWSNSHICSWLLKNYNFDYTELCQQRYVSAL